MIEIVTHCWCQPGTDMYAEMLRWQFASLVHWRPVTDVTWTICYCPNDHVTRDMLTRIRGLLHEHMPDNPITIVMIAMDESHLFRRAIGRNIAAKSTKAKAVWFTDVDYLFGEGAIDAVEALVNAETTKLCTVHEYQIMDNHKLGTQRIEEHRTVDLPKPDPADYKPKQAPAIGGLQIVGRNFCHTKGYLDGTRWVKPVDIKMGFRSCSCDAFFRKENKLRSPRIKVPNVFRLRHEMDGRDYDIDGKYIGRDAWW